MLLALFDIDGTLVQRAADAHRDAIHEALRTVHGVTEPARRAGIDVAGRTDPEIARGLLLAAGVSARRIDERADDVRIAACAAYARLCPADLSAHVTPGIAELLEALAARDDVRLALVTGNYEAIARLKLRRAGIGRYFASRQGGFGSDHEQRAELPRIARRRAGGDTPWPRERTVVIGDTPRDIACARADGVRAVALATGPFRADELRDADAVARNAHELGALLDEL
ncbi:MAG TPA: HAD family hydrolase [Solirubrobacteraceae bacterium]|nr:HAD family hydrolase [Solirubrobacteraceae bacterium]